MIYSLNSASICSFLKQGKNLMMALIFLLFFLIGVQILLNKKCYIRMQLLGCLFITTLWFNYHSHLFSQFIGMF